VSFDALLASLMNIQIWDIVKVLLEIGLLIYVIFSLIVIRQVDLMGHVIGIKLTSVLRLLAVIHFFVSIGIFLLALFIL